MTTKGYNTEPRLDQALILKNIMSLHNHAEKNREVVRTKLEKHLDIFQCSSDINYEGSISPRIIFIDEHKLWSPALMKGPCSD